MSKRELVKFIEQKRTDPGVNLGTKIAHSSNSYMYRLKCDGESSGMRYRVDELC